MKGNITLILSLCMIFLGINGCSGSDSGDSSQTANLSSNLTNETNSTCESNISSLIAQCDQGLDLCNENLCERCGDDMARAGGEPGTWACSLERLNNCVESNSCGGDGTLNWTGNILINYSNPKYCSDGTIMGGCSVTKPNYCVNATELIPRCTICGCPLDYICQIADGQCILI